jgi:glutamate synthase domain-containing protein 1
MEKEKKRQYFFDKLNIEKTKQGFWFIHSFFGTNSTKWYKSLNF